VGRAMAQVYEQEWKHNSLSAFDATPSQDKIFCRGFPRLVPGSGEEEGACARDAAIKSMTKSFLNQKVSLLAALFPASGNACGPSHPRAPGFPGEVGIVLLRVCVCRGIAAVAIGGRNGSSGPVRVGAVKALAMAPGIGKSV